MLSDNTVSAIPCEVSLTADGALTPMKLHVIPAWIYRAFTRKFSLNEIHTYAKLRQVTSIEDLAQLDALAWHLFDGVSDNRGVSLSCLCLDRIMNFDDTAFIKTPAEWNEMLTTIIPLAADPETVKEPLTRLGLVNSDLFNGCALAENAAGQTKSALEALSEYCRIVTVNDRLYIIVEEGFRSGFKDMATIVAFLTLVLKAAYTIYPIKVVNQSQWYHLYVKALAA